MRRRQRPLLARSLVAVSLVGICLVTAPRAARADLPPLPSLPPNPQIDDPYDVPLAPRPPTLPELTHVDDEIAGETTVGLVSPATPKVLLDRSLGSNGGHSATVVQRFGVEIPIDQRHHLYVGATEELALGAPAGGGTFRMVPSNLDLYGRIVWATRTGLTFGGGLGVLAPSAHFAENSDAATVAAGAQAIRPWDNAFFLDDEATFRAFVDVRDVDGRFVLQFREGMEASVSLVGMTPQVAAIAQAYVGFRVLPLLGVGLEAFETYVILSPAIVTEAEDHDRATFTLSPSIRLMTPYVQPALGFVTSIGNPIFGTGTVDGYWALRLGATIVWDPGAHRVAAGAGTGG